MDPRGGDRVREASVDIAAWLHGLGLQQYEQAFRENAIDDAVLLELTADDLKDLGISLVGHRRKLLAAIAALRSVTGPEPRAEARGVADTSIAERRHLTVMFCDPVGSTALSARLDAEDLRGIIGAYHRRCTELVERNGGFVAKYMGDGVLAYFGYPQAHEHDAERQFAPGFLWSRRFRSLQRMPVRRRSHDANRHDRQIKTGCRDSGEALSGPDEASHLAAHHSTRDGDASAPGWRGPYSHCPVARP
jgi:class 3 adenylate cyclase